LLDADDVRERPADDASESSSSDDVCVAALEEEVFLVDSFDADSLVADVFVDTPFEAEAFWLDMDVAVCVVLDAGGI
jgi:hypothetical protein